MHQPVLLQTVINSLDIKENGLYIDATLGEGGYSNAILQKKGTVLGLDLDESQYQKSNIKYQKEIQEKKIIIVQGNFADLEKITKENNFYPVDGIVFDLGLSMEQIAKSGRGFSYKGLEEPLDMRIDVRQEKTAEFLVNTLSKNDLYNVFAKNSEEIKSKAIADCTVERRVRRRIHTVGDLTRIIDKVTGKKDNAVYSRIFQALRIEVNNEFENLKKGLIGALDTISEKGIIAVVTFHSLEDRIVKQFIKKKGLTELKKVIKGNRQKSFERSAKLRVFIK